MNLTPFRTKLGLIVLLAISLLHCASALSQRDESGASATDNQSNLGRSLLPIRSFQQTTSYTCGPAVLLSLLRYHGRDGNELEIAKEANCTPAKGTTPQAMAKWLEQHGFEVNWGERGSLKLLRTNLKKGIPTIIEWIDWGGHWVMVVGYDTRGTDSPRDDVIIFADPADHYDEKRDGLTSFNALRFEHMWFDAFLFERPMRKIYITAIPKLKKE